MTDRIYVLLYISSVVRTEERFSLPTTPSPVNPIKGSSVATLYVLGPELGSREREVSATRMGMREGRYKTIFYYCSLSLGYFGTFNINFSLLPHKTYGNVICKR